MTKKAKTIKVTEDGSVINIFRKKECIKISKKHKLYLPDIINLFDFYFSAVEYSEVDGFKIVDFSTNKPQKVKGYDLHDVMFSSFVEPIETTHQYIELANFNEDSVVLDLGAYSGLSAILFDKEISKNNKDASGGVIAVDADMYNTECIENNFRLYKEKTGRNIDYLYGAAWGEDGEIQFSNEANMGASATSIVGKGRGLNKKVKSYTLSTIAKKYNLEKVDFIKCDIEGGEICVFKDAEFFQKYSPRIIVESHLCENFSKFTTDIFVSQLNKYGYACRELKQEGFDLPLVECYPVTTLTEMFCAINERFDRTDKNIKELLIRLNKPTFFQKLSCTCKSIVYRLKQRIKGKKRQYGKRK